VVADSEPFGLNGLEAYLINQEIIARLLLGDEPWVMCRKLQVEARWPLGEPGKLSFAARVAELQRFVSKIAPLGLGGRVDDLEVDLEVGEYRLTGRLTNLHEHGILLCRYGKRGGRDLLAGWLHYLIHGRQTGTPVEVVMLGKDDEARFGAGCGTAPELETMVEVFVDGCREPSSLYIEPGLAWLKKQAAPEAAHAAAVAALDRHLEDGYDRETALLLRGSNTATRVNDSFVALAQTVLAPLVGRVK